MKKILLKTTIFLISLTGFSQSFTEIVSYNSATSGAFDGISGECNVGIKISTTQNGVYIDHHLQSFDLKTLRIANKDIPASQVPSYVILDKRVDVTFDLYVNNVFVDRYGQPSVSWARLQGLPNSDSYKPATSENGYKLFNSGALSIRNVKVTKLNYRVKEDYYMQIRNEMAGKTNKNTTENPVKQGNSTSLTIENNSSNNNPVTQTGTTNTGIPKNTSGNDPLAHFDSDSKTHSNPMTNTSSGSSAVDKFNKNYQQGQQIADAVAPLASGLVDAWNRKIDRENAASEKFRLEQNKRVEDYATFCTETNKTILNWPYFEKNVIQRLPIILENDSPSWASILGTDKFTSAFGKDVYFIKDNFIPFQLPKKTLMERIKTHNIYPLKTSGSFFDFHAISLDIDYKYDYIMDNIKLDNRFNRLQFIYDDNKVVIGILIEIDTDGKAISIEKYYKDIISKIGNNYIMLDANTFLLRDKLIFFQFDEIHIYDLNYMGNLLCYKISNVLKANPSLDLAAPKFGIPGIKFNETLNIDQNNIKWKPTFSLYLDDMKKKSYYKSDITNGQLVIAKIDPESTWEKGGLMKGDIIKSVNNISTPYPLFFRLSTFAYRSLGNMNITYLRDGKEYETTIKLD